MKSFFLALFWAFIGSITVLTYTHLTNNPYLEYYTVENAVAVSPHDLRMEMDAWKNDSIIVDLRSKWEYEREHIIGAINIPGVTEEDSDALAQKNRIISEFRKLPKDKRIIVHCYTHYCMLAKHVGLMLAEDWINVHELNIGWNEWRNEWDLWNGKWTSEKIDISKYIDGTSVIKKAWSGETNMLDVAPCTKDGLAWC